MAADRTCVHRDPDSLAGMNAMRRPLEDIA